MHWPAWAPLVGGFVNLIVLALAGLAVMGKSRWRAMEEYEKLSEVRGERIAVLETEHQRYVTEMREKHTAYEQQIDLLTIRIEALTGTVSGLERNEADTARRNLELQRLLETSVRRVKALESQASGKRSTPHPPREEE